MKMIPNPALTACLAVAASAALAFSQTPHSMSAGDFTENFDDIADSTAWPNGFLSTEPWGVLDINTTGIIPSATRITRDTLTFRTEFTGGIQRGTGNLLFLSTGGTGDTSSTAVDLALSFSNRNAGTISFDAATVFNSTGDRPGTLRVYYTTNGTAWTELTGGGLPYVATNNVAGSQAVSVALPSALNEQASVRLRFYNHNSAGGAGGSRPKISVDNLLVTSTSAGADTTNPALASLTPANGDTAADIATTLRITFSEPVIAATGDVILFAATDPLTPVQTFPASTGAFSGVSATFTPSAPLAYDTDYHVIVDSDAFTDPSGNPFSGITTSNGWAFRTTPEPAPTPPVVVRLSPPNDSTGLPAGDQFLEIEYDVDVVRGTGFLRVFDINDTSFPPTPIASFDVSDTGQVAIENNIVGFVLPVPVEAGKSYFVSGPAGLFLSVAGNISSNAFGFDVDEIPWAFEIAVPDTTPPALVATSPQNGPGASVSPILTATFDEPLTLTASPWTVTVFDVTANSPLREFTELNSAGISVGGNQLAITLSAPLAFNNNYRVTLSGGIVADAAGNPSAAVTGSAWQFTTGGPYVPGQVVISQVYGGGGNSGASFRNDFVELHNKSESAIALSGWSVQYASATGTSWQTTPLSGTIQPGGYYLVQQAAGAGGTENLPTPDAIGTIGMAGTNGKVALSNSITPLTGASPLADASISDFVGYGTANGFEGTAATLALSNTTAAIRLINGSSDTDDNRADFTTGTPAPRNSSSPTFFPTVDGSGTAIASNVSSNSGSLSGSFILPSAAADQAVKISLLGSLAGVTVASVSIKVPDDFGVPAAESIALAGPAAAGASVQIDGQIVTISDATLTTAAGLEVTLSGLGAPDVLLSPTDDGFREFTVSTAQSGGSLTPVILSPRVRIALPVASISTLRAVSLPSPKAYILGSEAVATYVTSIRNQRWIQDGTAGILIDDQPFILGVSYQRGDGISSLVGTLNAFQGLLQFNPIAAVSTLSSSGNNPAPVAVTLAELAADPLLHQARLVRVSNVSFQTTPADFANESTHTLAQGSDVFNFRSFTGVDYITTPLPEGAFDLVGLVRRVGATPADFIAPRSLADFIITPVTQPVYLNWAADLAGGGAANEDFDNDGVPNGVEYFFGVNTPGFTPTPGIANGQITFPRDASLTDVSFTVQTSDDLVGWDDVLAENLNLSDPNSITYVLPNAPARFFVRISVVVAAAVD